MKMCAILEERHLLWCRERCDEARFLLRLIDQRGFRLEASEASGASGARRDATADLAEHLSRTINQLTSIINESLNR